MAGDPTGSITYIADGIFRSDGDPALPLSQRLPASLKCLQSAAISEKNSSRTLDQCVVDACFPDKNSFADCPQLPLASFSYGADVNVEAARDCHWLRCDPVVLVAGGRGLSLAPLESGELSKAESDGLAQTVASVLSEYGLTLENPASDRWYIRCDTIPEVTFSPPWRAQQAGVEVSMPEGPEAARWIERMSACQIALYADPVNQQRLDGAGAAVSSVWFWGISDSPGVDGLKVDQICSDSALARGIGRYTDCFAASLPDAMKTEHLLLCYEDCESGSSQAAIQFLLSSWHNGNLSQLTIVDPSVGEVLFSPNSMRVTAILRRWRNSWKGLRGQTRGQTQ